MKKRKIRSTMGVFFTTFLLLQIILLFLYKSFIVDIAKKNEENLVENTLQIYHNTMESVLERLDDNLDLLLGYRLLLTQLNGENNLEKVKAQYRMLQILKEKCQDTKEADAYVVVNCKDNSILIQRNGNITYDTIKDIKKYLRKRNMFDKTPTSGWTSTVMGEQVYLVKYYNYGANTIAVLVSEKRLDSLLNYNDMSIKEAAFYLTDKKKENSVRFRRGLDIWRSDRESAETGSIHQYLSGICSGRCISDVLQCKIIRVCRIFYLRYRYFWIFSTVFAFLWNNCLVYAKRNLPADCRPVLGVQKNSQWRFQGKSGI